MKVESFLKIVEEIEYSCLTEGQQEKMITKVADLSRFIQSYNPSIEIIDWMRPKISIIKHSGVNIGVMLCDASRCSDLSSLSNINLIDYKKREQLKELWLVAVNGSLSQNLKLFTGITEVSSLDRIYDKIFSFDFLQSRVRIIK